MNEVTNRQAAGARREEIARIHRLVGIDIDTSGINDRHRPRCSCGWKSGESHLFNTEHAVEEFEKHLKTVALSRSQAPQPAAVPKQSGEWQTMESAPKDGTRVLIAVRDHVQAGYWREDANFGDSLEPRPGWQIFYCDDDPWYSWAEYEDVTHWMPLPAAPSLQDKPQ